MDIINFANGLISLKTIKGMKFEGHRRMSLCLGKSYR